PRNFYQETVVDTICIHYEERNLELKNRRELRMGGDETQRLPTSDGKVKRKATLQHEKILADSFCLEAGRFQVHVDDVVWDCMLNQDGAPYHTAGFEFHAIEET
ncbi:unnamed protein product, partial [Darwinula stevensoni]